MTCKNCNAPLEKQARFCIKCGARVSESQESQLPATTPPDATVVVTPPRPKQVNQPVRPPKRPIPTQPTPSLQNADKKEKKSIHERHTTLAKLDEVDKKVVEPTLSETVDEPAAVIPHDQQSIHTNTTYDGPTIIVDRENLEKLKAEQTAHAAKEELQQNIATPVTPFDITTLPFEARSIPHPELVDSEGIAETATIEDEEDSIALSPSEDAQPLVYYRLNTTMKGSQKLPAAVNKAPYNQGRKKSGVGCILGCLTTFVILLLIVGAGWVFALRPYAHDIAQGQLDNALTSAIDQIPTQAKQLPPGITIPINENTINNLIVLNLAPSNPVQHPTTSITGKNIRLDFQLYNFPCAITLIPTVNNGQLAVNQVGTEGIFSAIMSPDEMTNLLNKHLNAAQSKLQRSISNVQLKDHEVDLTLN